MLALAPAWGEVCCCYSLSVMHVKRHGHRWVFFLPVVSALVAALQFEFFFDHQRFQLLRGILQWRTNVFACLRALQFEPGILRRNCSMHTSHPPGAMVWQYGLIPCVYGRIPTVCDRILPVYGHIPRVYGRIPAHPFRVYGRILRGIQPYTRGYTAVYSYYLLPILIDFDLFFVRIPPFLPMQVQYGPWPLRSITDYEVADPEVELMAPKAAAGQVVSGREYVEPIPVGRGDVASAPSDLACTTGKDSGYYSRLNVRASGALCDIRLPIRAIANLKQGVVVAIWGAALWSKSSGKVRVFLSTTGGKWSIADSIMVLQSFGGEPVPLEQTLALQAELAARAGNQLGGSGLKRAHDQPAAVSATPAAPPTQKVPKFSGSAAAVVAVSSGGLEGFGGVGGD